MSSSLNHLRKMKRRLETNPPKHPTTSMSPTEKMDMLEKTLNTFKTEVDMKLKIMQQILTTRNAQVTVQKKLLDREQNLYNALLAHWLNTPNLAASGVSMNFSAGLTENLENEHLDFDYAQEDFDTVPTYPATSTAGKPSKKPRRKRPKPGKVNSNPNPHQPGDGDDGEHATSLDADPLTVLQTESDDVDGNGDEDWSPSVNVEMETECDGKDGSECEQGKTTSDGEDDSTPRTLAEAHIPFGRSRTANSKSAKQRNCGPPRVGRPRFSGWDEFRLDSRDGRTIWLCKYCSKSVSGQAPRLAKHLENCSSKKLFF